MLFHMDVPVTARERHRVLLHNRKNAQDLNILYIHIVHEYYICTTSFYKTNLFYIILLLLKQKDKEMCLWGSHSPHGRNCPWDSALPSLKMTVRQGWVLFSQICSWVAGQLWCNYWAKCLTLSQRWTCNSKGGKNEVYSTFMFISQFVVRNYSHFWSSYSAKLRKWAFSSFLLIWSPALQRQLGWGILWNHLLQLSLWQ